MERKELPEGVTLGMSCKPALLIIRFNTHSLTTPFVDKTVVLTPPVFLPWLAKRLKDSGVTFLRKDVKTLRELKGLGHDVLVNATGWGSKFLHDVSDRNLQQVRGQTILVKSNFDKIFMRHGKDYTYVIPRLDGTAILGGIKQTGVR